MRVRVAHISLQFTDSMAKKREDLQKLFARANARNYAWLSGTESGSDRDAEYLVRMAEGRGYRPWVPEHQANGIASSTDCWIAVREDLIDGDWKAGYEHVFDGSNQLKDTMDLDGKDFGPKGLVHVTFESTNRDLGKVSLGAAHYLTGGHDPDSVFYKLNEKLGVEIGKWARREGRGRALVFYSGDQNMRDNRNDLPEGDTFFGHPLTSSWDELQHWENTGHGNIDVIASYNKDGRVKALRTHVLNDREFHMNTDHFLVEATFEVEPKAKR